MAFFASPGKGWLVRRLEVRNKGIVEREGTGGALQGNGKGREGGVEGLSSVGGGAVRPSAGERGVTGERFGGLGLPGDPEREVQEAVEELRDEVEVRRRRGSKIGDAEWGGVEGVGEGEDGEVVAGEMKGGVVGL